MSTREEIKRAYHTAYMREYRKKNNQYILDVRREREGKVSREEWKQKQAQKKIDNEGIQYKKQRISGWKRIGVLGDYDEMYDIMINSTNCNHCGKELKERKDKILDHDHETGHFRQILCQSCNIWDYWNPELCSSFGGKNKLPEELRREKKLEYNRQHKLYTRFPPFLKNIDTNIFVDH